MLIVRYHWGEDRHIRLMHCYQIIVSGYLLLNGLCQSVEPSLTLKSCTAYTHQWPSKRTSVLSELNTKIIFKRPKSNFLWNGCRSGEIHFGSIFESVFEKWALRVFWVGTWVTPRPSCSASAMAPGQRSWKHGGLNWHVTIMYKTIMHWPGSCWRKS